MKVKQRPDTALSHVGPLPLGRSEEGGERSMHPIQEDMAEFGAQLKHGAIQKAIIECNLAEDFDFADLASLTARIEANTAEFAAHIESFLSEHDSV